MAIGWVADPTETEGDPGGMTLLTDLEDFLHAHRSHRPLTADATEPAWNGYLLPVMPYPCGVVFGRWVTPEDADVEPFRLALLN